MAARKEREKMMRRAVFVSCVIAALLVAGTAVASDWQKLGKKNLAFGDAEETTTVKASGEASNITFRISGDWVRLTGVTFNFSDGSKQMVEEPENIRPGLTSQPIAIDGGPKSVESIDITFQAAASSGRGRATVIFRGQ
jgi:hypothetical protein